MSSEEGTYTKTLADFVSRTTFNDLPAEVVAQSKRLILDTIGCALGGYATDKGKISRALVRELGGKAEATVIGSGDRTSCTNAAFANANMANALDNDDCLLNLPHFAPSTVHSALSVGERMGSSGQDVIAAVALGYDIAARVGGSTGFPLEMREGKGRTWKGYGLGWQVLGGAVCSAKIMGLDAEQTFQTIGIAGSLAPVASLPAFSPPFPLVKYGDAGWTAQAGVTAAMLAGHGYTGYHAILDGDFGFWRMYGAEQCDFNVLTDKLGERWYIMDSSFKPWPSCRYSHHPLTLFTAIIEENSIKPEEIVKVTVRGTWMTRTRVFAVQEPTPGPIGTQFCLPHIIALAAYGIPPGPEWHKPEMVTNPEIQKLREKVTVEQDKDSFQVVIGQLPGFFKRIPTTVEVSARGRIFAKSGDYAKGDPWLPETRMTDDELKDKFRCNAIGVSSTSMKWRKRIEKVIEVAHDLEKLENVSQLMRLLAPLDSRSSRKESKVLSTSASL